MCVCIRYCWRYGYHFSDINWDLGHFPKFIFMIQYTLFYVKFHAIKNAIKNAKLWRETPVFWRFMMSTICFWSWISCHVEIMYRESWPYISVKNYEVHVLISLKACYNNSKEEYWRKHCNIGQTGLFQDLRETRMGHGNSMKYNERIIILYQTSQNGLSIPNSWECRD